MSSIFIICSYSSEHLTNKGLINFGKSLKNLIELNSISLKFWK